MAKFVLKNPIITLNAVDLSDHCSSCTIETQFDDVDLTAFGAIYKQIAQGLGDATMTFAMFQDFAAGSVDATLWPLSQSGSSFPVTVKPTNAAVGATNPRYDMTGVLLTYNPIDGGVGDASTTDVTIRNAAQTGLTRNIV
jgi:hypothetical protein